MASGKNHEITVNVANCEPMADILHAFKAVLQVVNRHPEIQNEVEDRLRKLVPTNKYIKDMFDL